MDGLSYTVELRDGASVAVGTFAPGGAEPIHFEMPFVDETTLFERVASLQNLYARLQG